MNLLIRDHKDSLESIQYNGKFVILVGKGMLKSPGHPSGNQQFYNQIAIFKHASVYPYLFDIFHRKIDNTTHYLGKYTLHDYKIKESFEGFRYYEFKMLRHRVEEHAECIFPS